jgi:acid phosphatase family membrane protein YuiD
MKIIIVSLVAIAVTQIIKTVWFYWNKEAHKQHDFLWPSFWMGGFPSSHTAMLTSALYAIWKYDGPSLLFGLGVVISLLLIYGLLEDKKRQILFEEYFVQSGDSSLQKIVFENRLLSFSGHSLFEIISGGLIGIIVGVVMTTFLL